MKPRVVTDLGIFVLSDSGLYERYEEPDQKFAYPGLILIGLCVIAWASVSVIGYAAYRIAEAVWGA